MKEIMKKVSVLKGVVLTLKDIHGFMEEIECYMDKGCFVISDSQKMTVKVKGKIVDNGDVTISFEDTEK